MRLRDRFHRCVLAFLVVAFGATISACSSGSGAGLAPPTGTGKNTQPRKRQAAGKIQHIVILIQENESFDHLFNGYPGANTVQSGKIHTGATVPLTMQNLGDPTNTAHYSSDFLAAYDGGKMDGFDLNTNSPSPNLLPYSYVDPSQIQPYYQMAQQYVLADKYFTSHIDASLVGHQYLIAAQSNSAVNLPTGDWGCTGPPTDVIPTLNQDRSIGNLEPVCFDYQTLADELDAAGFTWRYYAPYIKCPPSQPSCDTSGGSWSAYQAISHIYNGPDWTNDVISPETQILTDIPNGTLANVTWIVPNYCNSDHPGSKTSGCTPGGPDWIASVVNAIGESQFWDSTEILVTWDEWGGEYDHVKPPHKDFDGDGFRVPLLCITPYAYQGKVNHTALEAAGVPRFVEQTFGLAQLSAADKRAKSVDLGCTNPSQSSPRTFTPITASRGRNYFLHVQKRDDTVPPDDE